MNALLVIASVAEQQAALLTQPLEPGGVPLAFLVADRAARVFGRVFVCTDSPCVRELFAANGRAALLLPSREEAHAGGTDLTPEQACALCMLTERGLLPLEEPVVLADWRAPLLSETSLALAASVSVERGGGLAASLQPAHDHPAQGHVPYVFLGLETVAFPDAAGVPGLPAGFGVTRAFALEWPEPWEDARAHEAARFAVARFGGRYALSSISVREAARLAAGGERVYLRAGPGTARRLLPPGRPAPDARAVPVLPALPGPADKGLPLMFFRTRGGRIGCRARRGAFPPGLLLQLWPVRGLSIGAAAIFAPGRADENGSGGWTMVLPSKEFGAQTEGIEVLALALAGDARYDIGLPLMPEDGSWRWEPGTGARVNAQSGQRITGRQQLPPLFCADGLLLAGRPDRLLDSAAWAGPVAEIVVEERERILVRNAIDILKIGLVLRRG
ncbi:MAG: hypothetical protein AUJ49_01185 [Desulfovibrionaceae bacterium CG1_02_65_16]|nr:MAG: hypothetical protein AUJ49_01185 [Desulfovibrionaceae bacterium CG1_02_65_16]